MIPEPIAEFLEDGVGIHVGSRNSRFEPNGARALAIAVHPDRTHLTVFISTVALERLLPDLESNRQVAISCGRPVDERACQVKGVFISARPA